MSLSDRQPVIDALSAAVSECDEKVRACAVLEGMDARGPEYWTNEAEAWIRRAQVLREAAGILRRLERESDA